MALDPRFNFAASRFRSRDPRPGARGLMPTGPPAGDIRVRTVSDAKQSFPTPVFSDD